MPENLLAIPHPNSSAWHRRLGFRGAARASSGDARVIPQTPNAAGKDVRPPLIAGYWHWSVVDADSVERQQAKIG